MKKQNSKKEEWKTNPIGGLIIKPGSSEDYKTGSWKSFRPVWDEKKCIHCMFCYVYCPDNCIPVKDEKRTETDLTYCKGCGICAQVCPVKCIEMKPEGEFTK